MYAIEVSRRREKFLWNSQGIESTRKQHPAETRHTDSAANQMIYNSVHF